MLTNSYVCLICQEEEDGPKNSLFALSLCYEMWLHHVCRIGWAESIQQSLDIRLPCVLCKEAPSNDILERYTELEDLTDTDTRLYHQGLVNGET